MNPSDAADRLIRESGGIPPSAAEDMSEAVMDALVWMERVFAVHACPLCGSGALTVILIEPAHLRCDACGYRWEGTCASS